MSQKPIVAVTTDVKFVDGYNWHATVETYLKALVRVADVIPVLVPSLGDEIDFADLLARVDGVLVTGSRSNVHPELYGAEETEITGPHDRDRDGTSLPLIRDAIDAGVPMLAICRGIQELNVALGGSLISEVQELEGRMDHRASNADHNDIRFRIRHKAHIRDGGRLDRILGGPQVDINSLHRQAIGRLADGLTIEATAEDGTVEAVSVDCARAFAIGVQWHPEYWA
ncbi:MAG: gamma-glutamyl-gamma-aminobutyrate hydrolase family protein, partial [Rhodobiaceae bacterium]|nr:gamma-glutamyl-gamma-aminobutyrate hydrolase family protein [Rhodobiaceae bacterium]